MYKMATGIVKWFNSQKGIGSISPDYGEQEVFVHYTTIQDQGSKSLTERKNNEFEIVKGPKGPQAKYVEPI